PQGWSLVPTVAHEIAPLGVGDPASRYLVRLEKDLVPGPFRIEGKAGSGRANLDEPVAAAMPAQRLRRVAGRCGKLAVGRLQRVLGKGREDVGEEQLLVLLLMVDPQLDQLERFGREIG